MFRLCVCLLACQFVNVFNWLDVRVFVCLYVRLCVVELMCVSVCLFACLFDCLFVRSSARLFVCLSACVCV